MTSSAKEQHRQRIIEEAVRLLRCIVISTHQSETQRGEDVVLTVDPQWNEEQTSYDLLVTCFAAGNRSVQWEGMPLMAIPSDDGQACGIARLDSRGQTVFHNLPEGDYRISVSSQWFYSDEPVLIPSITLKNKLAAKGPISEKGWSPLPPVYESNDARVKLTVQAKVAGKVLLAFETEHPALVNAKIRFAFVGKSQNVETSDEVCLKAGDTAGLWVAKWEGAVDTKENCDLMFEVLLLDE